jgi:Mn2+/Fe2+ NRAMP family transporter
VSDQFESAQAKYFKWSTIRSRLTLVGVIFGLFAGLIVTLKLNEEGTRLADAVLISGAIAGFFLIISYIINMYLVRLKKKNYGLKITKEPKY